MESPWPYYAVLLFPLLHCGAYTVYSTPGLLLVPILGFVIVPVMDWILGPLNTEFKRSEIEKKELEGKWSFRFVMYLYTLLMLPVLWWSVREALKLNYADGYRSYIGLAIGMATVSSVGVNIAHELIHKTAMGERIAGKFILSCVGNFHYFVEHTRGHHKMVGTEEDAATARYGESFYSYWPRMISGSIGDVWELEIDRAKQIGAKSVWNTSNVVLQSVLMTLGIVSFLALTLGSKAIVFFFWQALGAWFLLDLINYVEHYGLVRERNANGTYAPITKFLSWDSPYPVSNIILFKVGLHSDHHLHAARRYQILESLGPQHPAGLLTMAECALVPPLWYRVMDERAAQVNKEATNATHR